MVKLELTHGVGGFYRDAHVRLKVGETVEVDDKVAKKLMDTGRFKIIKSKKAPSKNKAHKGPDKNK